MRKRIVSRKNYRNYIQSEAWQNKRKEFLESKLWFSKVCYVCGALYRPGFHVHHRTYKRLGNEYLNDLVLVCPEHHENIHEIHMFRRSARIGLWQSTKKARKAFKRKNTPKKL